MKRRVLAMALVLGLTMTCVPVLAETAADEQTVVVSDAVVVTPQPEEPAPAEQPAPDPVEQPAPEEEPIETPVEEPTEVPAEEPTEVPSEEPGEVPAEEPTVAPTEAPVEIPFFANARIELRNQGQLYYGDHVVLDAIVTDANAEYAIVWQYYFDQADIEHGEDPWVFCGKGDKFEFDANEANAALSFRVVLNGQVVSPVFTMPGAVERPAEPEATEEPEELPEEPEEQPEEQPEEEAKEPTGFYQRDEEGNLILDESGNPIPNLAEDATERPVEWLRDENGELILDENGDPIPTAFEPIVVEEEAPEAGLEDALNPERGIDIYLKWEGDELHFGDEVQMVAVPNGYENASYTLQWQTRKPGAEWTDVPGATEQVHASVLTEDNYADEWRVVLTVTDAEAA